MPSLLLLTMWITPALLLILMTGLFNASTPRLKVPVIASNRIGTEVFDSSRITFYGMFVPLHN